MKKNTAGLYYDMRKYIEIVIVALSVLLWLAMAASVLAFSCPQWGNFLFSFVAGSVYRRGGEAARAAVYWN